jgi:hypothetical protein
MTIDEGELAMHQRPQRGANPASIQQLISGGGEQTD